MNQSWQEREDILFRFERACQEHGASLETFLAELSFGHQTITPELLTELIRVDLEHRWLHGDRVLVEEYATLRPSLFRPPYLRQLVDGEIEVRRLTESPCDMQELRQRFPDLEEVEIQRWSARLQTNTTSTERSVETDAPEQSRGPRLQAGAQIGDYILEAEIGRGSFATVWKARHSKLSRLVAIKVPSAQSRSMPTAIERLQREARSIARINHPNIVQIYDVGNVDESPYIVSQFIDGPTLREVLARPGLTPSQTAQCVCDVARGLEEIHLQGIVHRDIKPANILMCDGNHPIVVDFGLAQIEQEHDSSLTIDGDLIGTPAYMSPEQARGEVRTLDARTDIYALGVILYQSLSSRLPFEGKREVVLNQIVHERPAGLPSHVNRDLRTITNKCLEKSPADRYATAAAVADDLERYLHGMPILARPPGFGERIWKWALRRPRVVVTAVLLLVGTSFLLGTAWQLRQVMQERDKSVLLEQDAIAAQRRTQSLLARTEADAGRLAMQRGQMKHAIRSFEKSIEMGYSDAREIQLARLEALIELGQLEEARIAYDELAAKEKSEQAELAPTLALWNAELASRSGAAGAEVLDQLRGLDLDALSKADGSYCRGLISDDALQSVKHYRDALRCDMFHHRARKCLIATLIGLGRLREAESELVASRHLCPEDDDFRLMLAVVRASLGDAESALNLLADVRDPFLADTWREYCEFIHDTRIQAFSDNSTTSPFELLGNELASRHWDLTYQQGFRIPLPIQQRFDTARLRASELKDASTAHRDKKLLSLLIELANSNPESSLWTLIGEMQLATNDVVAAKASFDRALELPAVLPSQAREIAKRGVIATRLYLGLIKRIDVEENMSRFLEVVPDVSTNSITSGSSCRAIVIALLQSGENELAQRWALRWRECSENPSDAIWHLALAERRLGNLTRSLSLWDEFLERNPNHQAAIDNRGAVLEMLRERVSPPASAGSN